MPEQERNCGANDLRISIFIKTVLTLLLGAALFFMLKVGGADFLVLAPRAYIDSVLYGRAGFDSSELLSSEERFKLARSWDSSNPVPHEYLGHIANIRAALLYSAPALQVDFLREAALNFDRAIALRPNLAVLWVDRMFIASRNIEVAEKLGTASQIESSELKVIGMALRRASFLAPWDATVLNLMVRVGRLRYIQLTPEERLVVDGAVGRAKQLNLDI